MNIKILTYEFSHQKPSISIFLWNDVLSIPCGPLELSYAREIHVYLHAFCLMAGMYVSYLFMLNLSSIRNRSAKVNNLFDIKKKLKKNDTIFFFF